jgi:hypothetical protein
MKLAQAQFNLIAYCFPTTRQHKTSTLTAMNGWLYFIKNAATCRDMPKE